MSRIHPTHRYANVRPSEARVPQFRGDVSAILLASAEALTWLATDADSIANYAPDGGGGVISVDRSATVSGPCSEATLASGGPMAPGP